MVTQEAVPPSVRIDLTPSFPTSPGGKVIVQVTASSIAPIISRSLTINGIARPLDQFGRASFIAPEPGIFEVMATATDGDGITGTTISAILVRDPTDRTAPVVTIDIPDNGVIISEATDVVGSVAESNLRDWQLILSPVSGGDSVELARGSGELDGLLGTGSIRVVFENGSYNLTLIARDISGRTSTVTRLVEINTSDKPDAYTRLETDFTLTVGGLEIPIARLYSSLSASKDGAFGFGWQFVLADPRIATNIDPTGREVDGFYNAFDRESRIYLTLPDGSRAGFTFDPGVIESGDRSLYQPAWKADVGVGFTLLSGSATLREVNGEFFEVSNGLPYNPSSGRFGSFDYAVIAEDGTRYVYSVANGLREIWAPDGNRLNWTESGIVATDGTRVAIERNSDGRVSRIVAPDGTQAVYDYDDNGNLTRASILEDGKRTWLGYRSTQDHLLTDIAGEKAETVRYDSEGRFLGVNAVGEVLNTTREFLGSSFSGTITFRWN